MKIEDGYAFGSYIKYNSVGNFLNDYNKQHNKLASGDACLVFVTINDKGEIKEDINGVPVFRCKIKT